MSDFTSLTTTVVFIVSLIPVFIGIINMNQGNRGVLASILAVIFSLNVIWYSVLLIEFIQPSLDLDLKSKTIFEFISVSLIFFIRFIFLFLFSKLFILLLNIKMTKGLLTVVKTSGSAVFGIWIFGILEFFVVDSNIIMSNLLIYTDILIFFFVIVSCIYLIYQLKILYEPVNHNAIKYLSFIFLISMILGFLKWLAGDVFEHNLISQRFGILFIILVMNILMSAWLIVYSNKLYRLKVMVYDLINSKELIKKYNISKREMDVIRLICEGYTNKEIADELFISTETVKDHNSRIFLKTEVKNRTQLAKLFLK